MVFMSLWRTVSRLWYWDYTMLPEEEIPSEVATDKILSDEEIKEISKMYTCTGTYVYVCRTAVQVDLEGQGPDFKTPAWVRQAQGVPVVVWRRSQFRAVLYVADITSGLPLWSCNLGKYSKNNLESELLFTITTVRGVARLRFNNERSAVSTYGAVNLAMMAVNSDEIKEVIRAK